MDRFVNDNNINISDVIDVIKTTDPGFVEGDQGSIQTNVNMLTGGGEEGSRQIPMSTDSVLPYVEILEQPAGKALRFRYECEGRSAGSIPGVNSTPENRTFPTIRVVGHKGRGVVVVSCVTKDPPYRAHPHNLVGKESCKRGVCTVEISTENMTVVFNNLGIQCVKKKDILEALRVREAIRVDPFRVGFDKRRATTIDLNTVRLCFQVFLEGKEKGKFSVALNPVVSDPIFDKKSMADLVICELSNCSSSVAGGFKMILLCEKVSKDDIQVKFYEEQDGKIVWFGYGDFTSSNVHKQTAITFRTPSYRNQQVEQPVEVFIQLKRPSDGAVSDPRPFQMLPLGADDRDWLSRKRKKFSSSPNAIVLEHEQTEAEKKPEMMFLPPMQHNFNLVKPELIDPFGQAIAGGTSPTYPAERISPLPPMSAQGLRPRAARRRTPSPMDCLSFKEPSMQEVLDNYQPPYLGPQNQQLVLQPLSTTDFSHQIPYSHPINPLVYNSVVPEESGGLRLQPLSNTAGAMANVLDLDIQQYNYDVSHLNHLDSAELAMLGTPLSESFSNILSIAEAAGTDIQQAAGTINMEERHSMTDSFTRMTNNTIQEICNLNNIYKPPRDIDKL